MTQYSRLLDEQWFDKIAGRGTPKLFDVPDEKIQTGTVGRAGEGILRDAFMFYQFAKKMMIEHGGGLSSSTKVMDFGCAWGRIIRFWLHDLPPQNLYGYDVQDRLLAFARRDVPGCNYTVSNAHPPLPDLNSGFDLIYAFSVFSHLPSHLADAWVQEFARVLKPGGIVCLTTRPRAHIEVAGKATGAHAALYAEIIKNKDEALASYDRGEFIFYPADGGGGLTKETYGEAIIPEAYVNSIWSKWLRPIGFFHKYSETYLQPCFVLKRDD